VAILKGDETEDELTMLANDVYQYFGLGCRNVTKLYVPQGYQFEPLLNAFRKYDELKNHNKYRNNFDYNLALYMLNNQYYMSNESILMVENKSFFSAIAVLHYEHYTDEKSLLDSFHHHPDIQAVVGRSHTPFGKAQTPAIHDFADNVNTIDFLNSL
jgi:hypothetical protein